MVLYKEFLKSDIHPIVMNGIIYRQLYGEYCDHRPSGDEDRLIRKSEYKHAEKILVANGHIPENKNVTPLSLIHISMLLIIHRHCFIKHLHGIIQRLFPHTLNSSLQANMETY